MVAVIDADEGSGDDAEREQPLKDTGALAAVRSAEAFGEVERDDDADQAAADALQQASEEERAVAVREGDHGDAGDEGETAERHERFAAEAVGEEAGEEGGEDAAEQDGGDDDGELAGVEAGGGFEVGKRTADDADVDAVEQAAESRNEEEKAVVALFAIGIAGGGRSLGDSVGHVFPL